MPIVTTFKILGDPDELLREKNEKVDPITKEVAAQNGGIEHLVAKTDEGLLIVNVWENEEGMEKTSAAVRDKAEELGLKSMPTDWHQYELLQRETP
jgi:hypothetical protein